MRNPAGGQSWAILVLASGLALALNLIVVGVVWDAIYSEGPGLSDNATQVLTGWGGGIIGIIGAYVGYRVGSTNGHATESVNAPSESGGAGGSAPIAGGKADMPPDHVEGMPRPLGEPPIAPGDH